MFYVRNPLASGSKQDGNSNFTGVRFERFAEAARGGTAALVALGCTAATAGKIRERLEEVQLRELEELTTPDRITAWLPGGSTLNTRYGSGGKERSDRWEFVGVVAEPAVRLETTL